MKKIGTLPEEGFIRLRQVLEVVPVGKSTWWNWVKQKKAPAPRKLSSKTTVWDVSEIREFLRNVSAP